LELVLILLAFAAGLRLLAEWLRVPYPSLLVVGGAALALVPAASARLSRERWWPSNRTDE
jgi:hypothetical protein